jgi:hypothetical protein
VLIAIDGLKRKEAKEAFKHGDLFGTVVKKCNVLWRAAPLKIFVSQFVPSGVVPKADHGMLFPVQKKVHFLAKMGSNIQRDASLLKVI